MSHGRGIRVTLTTTTNQFGFPIGSLTVSNQLPVNIALQWDLETFRGEWRKIADNHAFGLPSHGLFITELSHPIPEGLWRVRVRWFSVQDGRIYAIVRKFAPALVDRLRQDHATYSDALEAWQPPEVRSR